MIKTTPFGLTWEPWMDVPEPEPPRCYMCGEPIRTEGWEIDDKWYCLECENAARDALWEHEEVFSRKVAWD